MSLLALSNISFAYAGGRRLFENTSFSVNPTDRMVIVGLNGAGKSTLLRLLTGELAPTAGEIVARKPLVLALAGQGLSTGSPPLALFDFVFEALATPASLRKEIWELEGQLSNAERACEYAARLNDYEGRGGYL